MVTETPDDLSLIEELEELEVKASPGPWVDNTYSTIYSAPLSECYENLIDEKAEESDDWWRSDEGKTRLYSVLPRICSVPAEYGDTAPKDTRQRADAELIAKMRNYLPRLLLLARKACVNGD